MLEGRFFVFEEKHSAPGRTQGFWSQKTIFFGGGAFSEDITVVRQINNKMRNFLQQNDWATFTNPVYRKVLELFSRFVQLIS